MNLRITYKAIIFSTAFLMLPQPFAKEEKPTIEIGLSRISWSAYYVVPKDDKSPWIEILPGIMQQFEKKFQTKIKWITANTGEKSAWSITISNREELYSFF